MRLSSIRIENLRSFCDETIPLDGYTCLVGANGSGKSTVLTALNLFFREKINTPTDLLNLDREDFHKSDTSKPVRVTVTFIDLSAEERNDFEAYHRHGKLVITAEALWDEVNQRAEVKQIGERMGIDAFGEFYTALAEKKKKPELEALYGKLAAAHALPAKYGSATTAEENLRKFEAANLDLCKPIPSATDFYGYTGGDYLLSKYVQWVYVPAVKDAATEEAEGRDTCLSKLLDRAVKGKLSFDTDLKALRDKVQSEYDQIVGANQTHLDDLSASLKLRIQEWSHPDTRMMVKFLPNEKSLQVTKPPARITAGEGIFDGAISRFGHGLQRCFLLAILQELASGESPKGPKLILGIEEPELYQHPPQVRHLASVLQSLATGNSQIVVCTHSPHFVTGSTFENVRVIRRRPLEKDACAAYIDVAELGRLLADARGYKPDLPTATIAKINQVLQPSLNEMFFAPVVIFVEGLEDVAYLMSYLTLTDRLSEFRRLGCHVVPVNGKDALVQPIAIANMLEIPQFVFFDSDADEPKPQWLDDHRRDNSAILKLMGHAGEEPLPKQTLWKDNLVMWRTDIGGMIREEFGDAAVIEAKDRVKTKNRLHCKGSLDKNSILIGYLLADLTERGKQSPTLTKLTDFILKYAADATGKNRAEEIAAGVVR